MRFVKYSLYYRKLRAVSCASKVFFFLVKLFSFYIFQLILMSVLNCLYDSVSQILRKNVEKRAVLEALDIVMLAMDEICDGGIIIDADSTSVVSRVALRSDDIPIGEQTVAQVTNAIHSLFWWNESFLLSYKLVQYFIC